MLSIVYCPICGGDQFAAGPNVYWNEFEHVTDEVERRINTVERVLFAGTNYCTGCNRLIRTGSPRELEMDLVKARRVA